jgi:hypothetical protein
VANNVCFKLAKSRSTSTLDSSPPLEACRGADALDRGAVPESQQPLRGQCPQRLPLSLGLIELGDAHIKFEDLTVLWFRFNKFSRCQTEPVKERIRPQITISGHKVEPFSITPKTLDS